MKSALKYFVLAATVQSVLLGGGYGTGREVVEFFTRFGLVHGLLGLGVAALGFFIVAFPTLEIARTHKTTDYVSYFKEIIGAWWILFEILFAALLVLILSVIGSAAGLLVERTLGVSPQITTVAMLLLLVALTFWGRNAVLSILSIWSVVLYAFFAYYLFSFFSKTGFGDLSITHSNGFIEQEEGAGHWLFSGVTYIFYNVVALPVLLYAVRGFESRRSSLIGALAITVMYILPAVALHLSFSLSPTSIRDSATPLLHSIEALQIVGMVSIYMVVLFGTFVETGLGLIQGLLERIENGLKAGSGGKLPRWAKPMLAIGIVSISAGLSKVGIISLIGKGYVAISWGFFFVYVLPTLFVGYKLVIRGK